MFSSNQNISVKTKEEMAKTLLQTTQPEVFRTGKPLFVHIDQSPKLFDLIGPESWFLFTALNISHDWLSLPCREWETSGDFCYARDFMRTVKVVNDAAERGVKQGWKPVGSTGTNRVHLPAGSRFFDRPVKPVETPVKFSLLARKRHLSTNRNIFICFVINKTFYKKKTVL